MDDYSIKDAYGLIHRLPLAPLSKIPGLIRDFKDLKSHILTSGNSSFDELWNDFNYTQKVQSILKTNGLNDIDLTDNQIFSLCVGYEDPPILSVYNHLDKFPVDLTEIKSDLDALQEYHNRKGGNTEQPTDLKIDDLNKCFPVIGVDNKCYHPKSVPFIKIYELNNTYKRIISTIENNAKTHFYKSFHTHLIYSKELQILVDELLSMFGLNIDSFNINQIVDLAISYGKGDPVLIRWSNYQSPVDEDEEDQVEIESDIVISNTAWYKIGRLMSAGVPFNQSYQLINTASVHEIGELFRGVNYKPPKKNVHLSEMTKKQKRSAYEEIAEMIKGGGGFKVRKITDKKKGE